MAEIIWGEDPKTYVYGIDRGLLHGQDSDLIVPWNGLTKVGTDEVYTDEVVSAFDGRTYANVSFAGIYAAKVSALSFPYEMMSLNGELEVFPGFILTGQIKERFNFSYRTFENDEAYKLHFVWNATFNQKSKGRDTLSDKVTALEFEWDISASPVPALYWHPTAYMIVDSMYTDPELLYYIESYLYGTDESEPAFPTQDQLLLAFL